jgi:PadR family transcriptional regulator PadR
MSNSSRGEQADLLQGTLNMMVLQVLSRTKANGYEIAKRIEERSDEALHIDHGSLYPALRRLESNGLIKAKFEISPTNRKARYYELTPAGRKQIDIERERWRAAAHAITRVMRTA